MYINCCLNFNVIYCKCKCSLELHSVSASATAMQCTLSNVTGHTCVARHLSDISDGPHTLSITSKTGDGQCFGPVTSKTKVSGQIRSDIRTFRIRLDVQTIPLELPTVRSDIRTFQIRSDIRTIAV